MTSSSSIARNFSRSAVTYDSVSVLQREIGERLLERLEMVKIAPISIMDLGSGTGFFSRILEKFYQKSWVYNVDRAIGMLRFARSQSRWLDHQRFIQADACELPFQDQNFDLIFSNLTLHWCVDLKMVFQEIYRVLKPGGFFIFSMMGPDTLMELRESWKAVDNFAHVNHFVDMHHVGDALLQTGWEDPVMDMEYLSLEYSDIGGLFDDLRKLGANNNFVGRRTTLTGKNRFKQMIAHYEALRREGLLPASYEIVYGHAWRPLVSKSNNSSGEVEIAVKDIRRL